MSTEATRLIVSEALLELRKTLSLLNRLVWTTELSYGFVLSNPSGIFSDQSQKTIDVLGHVVDTQVWYPNRHGKIRFGENIGIYLNHVRRNTSFVYRSAIVFFLAAFEEYLLKRISADIRVKTRGSGWGPYLVSLSHEKLTSGDRPIHVQTLLCADFCREIRNHIAHRPLQKLPASVDQSKIEGWLDQLKAKNEQTLADHITNDAIKSAKDFFFGEANRCVKSARAEGRYLPTELFYMLFTFANLDKLAIEIENALPVSDGVVLTQKQRRIFDYRAGHPRPIVR
jgi:hypothetical protein